ncbi:MAG: NADH-quinone oxidoreductase subunit NuoN [Uliginosibacterium sp.]|nr:NADH-quinone oxidoreductase subunit NuoN [Uliginosibacterium sp.]
MNFQIPNFLPAIAEIFQASMALLILLIISFCRHSARASRIAFWLSLTTLLAVGAYHFLFFAEIDFAFGQMFFDDPIGDVLKSAASFCVAAVLIYGRRHLQERNLESPEYYIIVLLAALGICVLISAGSLVTIYVGLELLSLASYALVALDRDSVRSTEAAMKYFVLGALASGLLLYGMSMVYGATQSLNLVDIAIALNPDNVDAQVSRTVLLFGLVFLMAGIAFKIGLVPFHMWIPDVYEGAPTPVTLFIASTPKLAAFAMAYRLLAIGMWDLAEHWQRMLLIVGMSSIVLGNLAAIAQTSFKRMLAYSGISHMGFMVLGLASFLQGSQEFAQRSQEAAYSSALFYVLTYALTALAAFGILLLFTRNGRELESIEDFKGLGKTNGWWAGMMAVVMFSMAGIPFFVGFFSKFYILHALLSAGHLWLAVAAVMMSLIGAFYYLRVVKVMFFDAPAEACTVAAGFGVRSMLSANVLAIAVIGIYPGLLMDICFLVVDLSM